MPSIAESRGYTRGYYGNKVAWYGPTGHKNLQFYSCKV
jgi:hypothetical protein